MSYADTEHAQRSRGAWSAAALVVAGLWSIALLVGSATLPVYHSTSLTGTSVNPLTTTTSTGTATLLEVNGNGVLVVVVSIPLVAVALVSLSLLWRGRRRRNGAGPFAWTVVSLLGVLTFLGMMSIGVFLLPVVALLAIACAAAPQETRLVRRPPGQVPT